MTTLPISDHNNRREIGEWALAYSGEGSGARWEAALCLSEVEVDALSAGEEWEVVLSGKDGAEIVLEVEQGQSGVQWLADRALVTVTAASRGQLPADHWAKDTRGVYSLELRASGRGELSPVPCVRFSMAV